MFKRTTHINIDSQNLTLYVLGRLVNWHKINATFNKCAYTTITCWSIIRKQYVVIIIS